MLTIKLICLQYRVQKLDRQLSVFTHLHTIRWKPQLACYTQWWTNWRRYWRRELWWEREDGKARQSWRIHQFNEIEPLPFDGTYLAAIDTNANRIWAKNKFQQWCWVSEEVRTVDCIHGENCQFTLCSLDADNSKARCSSTLEVHWLQDCRAINQALLIDKYMD